MVELVDTQDLKSCGPKRPCGFDSRLRYIFIYMACHCLHLKDSKEFFKLLKDRDPDLVLKMVKCGDFLSLDKPKSKAIF